jgi:hypothetical protein
MSLRYFDGFDFYATGDLAARYNIATGGFFVYPTSGRFNTGAVGNALAGGGDKLSKFFGEQPTWIVGFCYRFVYSGYATILCSLANASGNQVELRLDANSYVQITANGTVLATGTTSLLPNTWYYLELKATISKTCPPNSCVARIGGVVEVTVPAGSNTDPQNTGTASRVTLNYDNFRTQQLYDDFYVLDGSGTHNNDFLGDVRVETLLPNAQGVYQDFAVSGAASNFQAVNEPTQNGDTSYVYASQVGKTDTYRFPNLVSNPDAIAGMQLITIVRKDDAGSHAMKGVVRIGGTDYLGVEQGVQDSYCYLTTAYELNPATGLPWDGTAVNGVEAGFRITR